MSAYSMANPQWHRHNLKSSTLIGDRIVFIPGAKFPVILRLVDDYYILVGSAHFANLEALSRDPVYLNYLAIDLESITIH